jgi:hypothetical protein
MLTTIMIWNRKSTRILAAVALLACSAYLYTNAGSVAPELEMREIPAPGRAEYRTTRMYPAEIKAGSGTAVITPSSGITAGRAEEFTITYTVGDIALQPNDGIIVLTPHCFSKPVHGMPVFEGETDRQAFQKIGNMAGFTTATASNPNTQVALFCDPTFDLDRLGEGSHLFVNVSGAPLQPGETITIKYGDPKHGSVGAASLIAIELEFAVFVYRQMDWQTLAAKYEKNQRHAVVENCDEFYLIENSPRVWVEGADAVKLIATNPSDVVVGEYFDITVAARDRLENISHNYEGAIQIVPQNSVQPGPGGLMNVERRGVTRLGASISAPGVYRLEVRDAVTGLTARSNPVRVHASEPERRIYWGDPHTHSVESDGLQTMSAAYRYARDVTDLDVCMITDHLNGVDPVVQLNADAYNAPGRFVTFNAFERSGVAKGGGDMILYFRDSNPAYQHALPEPSGGTRAEQRNFLRTVTVDDIVASVDKFPRGDIIIIPHNHNGRPFKENPAFKHPVMRDMEIFSVWGNSEFRETTDRPYHFGELKRTFFGALEMGCRMGVVAGGDGHSGRPGWDIWLRVRRVNRSGLTAFPATGLTRDEIWKPMWERRTYGTTGERNLLEFSVNDSEMGALLKQKSSAPRRVKVYVETTDDIRDISIIKNNSVVHQTAGDGVSARLTWVDESPAATGDYYYVRVVQAENHVTWSSPVWVETE